MPINDKLNRIKEIKGNIKDAIVEKGVEVTDSDSFNSYADKIRAISGGSEPEKPVVVPQTPWVKPEGWPDIKEGIQDNQIRMLVCDRLSRGKITFNLDGMVFSSCDCTIDWGDGSEPEIVNLSVTHPSVTHTFNTDNSFKYTDENGITYNMYIVVVDCRDISLFEADDDLSKNMILWYVDSLTPEYESDIALDFYLYRSLQCVECLGGKERGRRLNFYNCSSLKEFRCSNISKLTGLMDNLFYYCSSLTYLDVSNWDTSNVTSMRGMFQDCSSLTSLDVSNWDTGNVTTMENMFLNCKSLTSLDVSNWDTSKVNEMSSAFEGCKSLTYLDVSNWDTGKVGRLYRMFKDCSSLTSLDVSNWDTSSATNMSDTFNNCSSLTSLDLSNWDTSGVSNMYSMFLNCSSLTSLDLSNWDTSGVSNMASMFQDCSSLTSIDVSSLDTGNVTSMAGMFKECSSLTSIDVSSLDTGNVTTMENMFLNCKSLTSLDVSNWVFNESCSMTNLFSGCNSLKEINPTKWDFSSVTGSGYSSKCKGVFYGTKLEKLDVTLQDSVDQTSYSYLPVNVNTSGDMMQLYNFSLTIPRPKFAIGMAFSSSYKNYALHHLIIKGQDGMTFTASSPQIKLDYTYAFKEEQINEFFTNLPTVTNSPTISLKGNPHAGYANMGIALEKGWNVLYDSAANSASTIPLDGEEKVANLPLAYRFIPGEDGTFVDANGNKCNLLYSQSVATMNPTGWEMLPTFEDALNKYGIEVEEEYREEIAKDVLAYANDDSLIKRYNIELD